MVENLIVVGIEEKVVLLIFENCLYFIEKFMECVNEVDEILGWVNLSLGVEEEGFSMYGLVKFVKLSDLEFWCVVFEFVGVCV